MSSLNLLGSMFAKVQMRSNLAERNLSLTWSCSIDLDKKNVNSNVYGKEAINESKERNGRDKPIDFIHGIEKYTCAPPRVDHDDVNEEVPFLLQGMEVVHMAPPSLHSSGGCRPMQKTSYLRDKQGHRRQAAWS